MCSNVMIRLMSGRVESASRPRMKFMLGEQESYYDHMTVLKMYDEAMRYSAEFA